MLASMVPALVMVDAELWFNVPWPWIVTPLPMFSVCAPPTPARIEPPAMLIVALPPVLMLRMPAPVKSHRPVPRLAVTPLPSVNPLSKLMTPLVTKVGFSALPSVTPSSVPPVSTVPSPLTTVPPVMLPVNEVRPPVPKIPPEPMSSVPELVMLPLTLTEPPVRLNVPSPPLSTLPLMFSTVLGPTLNMPELLQLVADIVIVPAVRLSVPVLVKLVGLMVRV